MSDTSYPVYQHYGTAAQRAAFTPAPPATGQPVYIWYETDTNLVYLYYTAWVAISAGGSTGSVVPQGRVTLTTAVPYLVATVTAATTIYYTPAVGNQVPLYNGSAFAPTTFAELSQTTTDNTKSPAAVGNNLNYDLFVWTDAGTIRCTRGPAWTSDTGRGTGAGTTQLTRTLGVLLNTVDITNGPAALRGTYVGTVRSNGSAQINFIIGGAGGAGGEGTILGLWNMYNRSTISLTNFDNTNSWTYSTATWRVKNGNSGNRISLVCGLQGDGLVAINAALASHSAADNNYLCAVGVNSETVVAVGGAIGRALNAAGSSAMTFQAQYARVVPLGFNYLAPLEQGVGSGTTTWIGDAGGTDLYSSFIVTTTF